MSFQIHALSPDPFSALFSQSDEALAAQNIHRMTVKTYPGSPCRVSLEDAQPGETVLLLNFTHQNVASPYKASHAIYVREGARQADLPEEHVPEVLRRRLISVRMFDRDHMMIDADVVDGKGLAQALPNAFANEQVAYIHLHNAKQGCFAACVTRAG